MLGICDISWVALDVSKVELARSLRFLKLLGLDFLYGLKVQNVTFITET